MGIFERLLGKRKMAEKQPKNNENSDIESCWKPLPAFVSSDRNEHERVSLIATAIAAGDHPNSQFVVKRIMKRNPEIRLVSVIAASLTATTMSGNQLNVKRVAKKK